MIRHYYTLLKLAESFKKLIGFQVKECFTQEKDTITIELSDGINTETLHFAADPKFCSLYLRYNFKRAGKNTTDLMPDLLDEYLQDISVQQNDRVIILEFVSVKVFVQLYGASESNFIITRKQDHVIIDALNKKKAPVGEVLKLKQPNNKNFRQFAPEAKLRDILAKSTLLLGKDYAEEFIIRQGLDLKVLKSDFKENDLKHYFKLAKQFKDDIIASDTFYLYRREDDSLIFSMIELEKYPVADLETDNLHKAIQMRLSFVHKEDTFSKDWKDVEKRLEIKITKIRRNIGFASDFSKTEEKIEKFSLWVEILLAQANVKGKTGQICHPD